MSNQISLTNDSMEIYSSLLSKCLDDIFNLTCDNLTRPVRVVGEKTSYKPLLEFADVIMDFIKGDFTKLMEERFEEYEQSSGSLEHMAESMNCGEEAVNNAREWQRKMHNKITDSFSDMVHVLHRDGMNWDTSVPSVNDSDFKEIEAIILKFEDLMDKSKQKNISEIDEQIDKNSLFSSLVPVVEYIYSEYSDSLHVFSDGIKKELQDYMERSESTKNAAAKVSSDLASNKRASKLFSGFKLDI